jgi:DNA-binding transcriptional LysR family regulator
MDWDDLRLLVEVGRRGSLTGAARALGLDHTTVGRRLRRLERDLAVRLFDRVGRRADLTAEGRQVLAEAEAVEAAVLGLSRRVDGGAPMTGTVAVSAPPLVASHFLVPRLGPLRAAHPDLRIEMLGDARSVRLDRREADVAVRLVRPEQEGLVTRRLGGLGFGLYAAAAYVRDRPDPADWEVIGHDLSMDHLPQQQWLRAILPGRDPVVRANSLAAIWMAVRAGLGVAALPHFLATGGGDLKRLPVGGDGIIRDLWLVVHPDLRRSPRVRAVMDFLIETVAAAAPVLTP